jgi:hypothetical protein
MITSHHPVLVDATPDPRGGADATADLSVEVELPALWWIGAVRAGVGASVLLSVVLMRAALGTMTVATP